MLFKGVASENEVVDVNPEKVFHGLEYQIHLSLDVGNRVDEAHWADMEVLLTSMCNYSGKPLGVWMNGPLIEHRCGVHN